MKRTLNLHLAARPQFLPLLTREQRWACIVAHRRAGKTVACVMDLIASAVRATRTKPRFAYVGPTYAQAKDVAWAYCKDYTAGIPGAGVSESELSVTFAHNGARIRLYGAENYDRIRGLYLDGVVIDEAGDIDPRAWPEVIRPALADRGGWATFIGTPKGRNGFFDIWRAAQDDPAWHVEALKASATGLIAPAELDDARKALSPEQYAQEFECSFDAAIVGAYYGRDIEQAEAEGRIGKVPYDRAADVMAAWDLGIGDATAIWLFQIIGMEWHFIDYFEASGEALGHYVDWIKARPFAVHRHLLPHDAEARELQTGNNRVEFMEARGLAVDVVPRHGVDDGIEAVRVRFNRFFFDKAACARGLDALRMYRTEYDHKRQALKPRPLHDWASHGADALRCAVMGADERPGAVPDTMMELDWVV